jgi:hypothetical protein
MAFSGVFRRIGPSISKFGSQFGLSLRVPAVATRASRWLPRFASMSFSRKPKCSTHGGGHEPHLTARLDTLDDGSEQLVLVHDVRATRAALARVEERRLIEAGEHQRARTARLALAAGRLDRDLHEVTIRPTETDALDGPHLPLFLVTHADRVVPKEGRVFDVSRGSS